MVNWCYYPRNLKVDSLSLEIVEIFNSVIETIDSAKYTWHSNEVLSVVAGGLHDLGFRVETGKSKEEKIYVPVLFGKNGRTELSFEADAFLPEKRYVIEVEAGRAVVNHQFLKDFFEACCMYDADYLCIAVRNIYKGKNDFDKICAFFDALYSSGRLQVPLKGLLIIGY